MLMIEGRINAENAKELGRLGGIKSGESKRRKKEMREAVNILLDMPLKSGRIFDVEEVKSLANLKGKNLTVEQAMLVVQVQKALRGDTNALLFLRDTSGQKPSDRVEVTTIEVPKFEGESELED